MNKIITIARQFGSGGRLIGKELAQKLNIPFLGQWFNNAGRQRGRNEPPRCLKGGRASDKQSALRPGNGLFPPGFSAPEPGGLTITDNLFMVQAGIIAKKAK